MDVNIVKLKSVARKVIFAVLPRYPFVHAITLLMLLAERALSEKLVLQFSVNRRIIEVSCKMRGAGCGESMEV